METTPDTLFQIGSISRIWTAVLVLQLVDEDLVELDDPVQKHLPEFSVADADTSATITIRHLLTHRGGFDGDYFLDTGGALTMSAASLSRFGAMLAHDGVTDDGIRILSAQSARLIRQHQVDLPVPDFTGDRFGHGAVLYDLDGGTAFGHDGQAIGQTGQAFIKLGSPNLQLGEQSPMAIAALNRNTNLAQEKQMRRRYRSISSTATEPNRLNTLHSCGS